MIDISHKKIVQKGEHLLWEGYCSKKGYAIARRQEKTMLVHRIIWENQHGPIPDNMWLVNQCGHKNCVRTAHWKLVPKGQGNGKRKPFPGRYSEEVKEKARQMRNEGMSYQQVSAELGPSIDTISRWCE
tara:strand:+ start:326 stop:712 length:387 start_codon:yes stop_codon:yes gene_type:complete